MSNPKKPAQQKTKPAGTSSQAIKVIPKRAGFRRAGYAFPEEGLTIRLSELTDEQLAQLENEPMLVVVPVEVEAPATDEADPAKPAEEATGE
ncbi:HI1506-related protein [Comamonas thiooxydans]|uniref:HI1506-related protein n=1 Tax=Comamonas thiooxydans TaxID=363952 RepID=UPI00209BCAB8|nr:HI1506-related protein [Comamonas thiooxydans]MCO8248482.1 HI1506-related protein [Comamonas thiooxydans]